MLPGIIVPLAAAAVILIALAWSMLFMRSRGYTGAAGGRVIVRCREGHLFTTVWVPLVSIKAIRLGPLRFQYCPVGSNWTFVTPVDPAQLSQSERAFAESHPDSLLP